MLKILTDHRFDSIQDVLYRPVFYGGYNIIFYMLALFFTHENIYLLNL